MYEELLKELDKKEDKKNENRLYGNKNLYFKPNWKLKEENDRLINKKMGIEPKS
jgi:hypothetical protein